MTHVWAALLPETVGLTLVSPISADERAPPPHSLHPGEEGVLRPGLSHFLVSPVVPRYQPALCLILLVNKGKELETAKQ